VLVLLVWAPWNSVRNEPRFQALVQKIDRIKAESKK
jgi:hypothetical protein